MNPTTRTLDELLRHERFLQRLARSLLTSNSEADDLVQETWLRAVRRPPDPRGRMLGWLRTVTRHLAQDWRVSALRRERREAATARAEVTAPLQQVLERRELQRQILEALGNLPDAHASAIVLRYFDGLPPREIARRLSVSVETVKKRLTLGLAELRHELDGKFDGGRTGWTAALPLLAGVRITAGGAAGTSVLPAIVGGFLMSTNAKIVCALVVVAIGALFLTHPFSRRAATAPAEQAPAAPAHAPAEGPARTPVSADTRIVARAFFEDEAQAAPPPKPQALQIELIGPKGRPSTGARLVLGREKGLFGVATTDGDGLAALDAGEGSATLYIFPMDARQHRTTIDISPGRRRVELPAGVAISGRVEVDGSPPVESGVCSVWESTSEAFPGFVYTALRGNTSSNLSTNGSGAFEFGGLQEGAECRFGGTLGYELVDVSVQGRPAILVTAPASDVLVKLHRAPVIRGRVVTSEGHVPVSGAECMLTLRGTNMSMSMHVQSDDRGEFRFMIPGGIGDPKEKIRSIEVNVATPGAKGQRSLALDPIPDRDHDLGDLELPATRTIRFVVRDRSGTPIKDAFARAGEETDPSTRTDAAGSGTIVVAPEAKTLVVGALKHDVVEVPIPPGVTQPVAVTLSSAAVLEIRLETRSGVGPETLSVRIAARTAGVFRGPYLGTDPVHVAAGATTRGTSTWNDADATLHFVPGIAGTVVVPGLRPGVPLEVSALDALGGVLVSTTVSLREGEWKTVGLAVPGEVRSLHGMVQDQKGTPIAGASVTIYGNPEEVGARSWGVGNSQRLAGATDSEGRFAIGGLLPDRIHFAVDKIGFVPLIHKDFLLPPDGGPLALTLQKGGRLAVFVKDAEGSPLRTPLFQGNNSMNIRAELPGYPYVTPAEKAPGIYVFEDLPLGSTATVKLIWAGREWTRAVLVKEDRTEEITMPPTGRLVVDYAAAGKPPFRIRLVPKDEGGSGIQDWIHSGEPGTRQTHEMTPVLPGDYTAFLDKADETPAAPAQSVTVRAGETTTVTFWSIR